MGADWYYPTNILGFLISTNILLSLNQDNQNEFEDNNKLEKAYNILSLHFDENDELKIFPILTIIHNRMENDDNNDWINNYGCLIYGLDISNLSANNIYLNIIRIQEMIKSPNNTFIKWLIDNKIIQISDFKSFTGISWYI
jgi:hypothetical protein